jgi:hypothetical protein
VLEPTPLPVPTSERDRDTCAVCRSPLNPAARYCLQCGERRAGARLEFLDVLDDQPGRARAGGAATTAGSARPAVAAAAAPPSRLDTLRSWPFGLTAVVLLALLIGLLAGHWLSDRTDDTAATQVIRVEGTGAAAGTALPSGASTATPSSTTPAAATDATNKAKDTKKESATAPKKITRDSEQKALDDTSGNENLAPADSDPDGANFDEIK